MTYSPLVGESLYDVATKLYPVNPMAGVQDLIESNPTLDLNATDLNGLTLTYNPITIPPLPQPVIPIIQPIPSYTIGLFQSIYDLAIQLYGDINKISLLLSFFSNINSELSGTITFSTTSPVNGYLVDRNILVQTSFDASSIHIGSFILRQDGGYLLRQDGGRFPRN